VRVVWITIMATFFTQMGYFFWKMAANSIIKINTISIKDYLLSWKWLLGLICTILGWLFFIKATDIGEISFIEPLMSAGDFLLIILAAIFLKERLTKIEYVGVLITILSAIMLSIGANEIRTSYVDWFNLSFFIILSVAFGSLLFIKSKKSKQPEVMLAFVVGIGFGVGAVLTELMTSYLRTNKMDVNSLSFIINPIFPFMLVANLLSIFLIQIAFQKGRSSVIVPIQLSVASALSVLGGSLLFAESISTLRIISVIGIIIGSVLLQRNSLTN
jgi:uncharacterized membrane protein